MVRITICLLLSIVNRPSIRNYTVIVRTSQDRRLVQNYLKSMIVVRLVVTS